MLSCTWCILRREESLTHNHLTPNLRPLTCPACAEMVQDVYDAFDRKK